MIRTASPFAHFSSSHCCLWSLNIAVLFVSFGLIAINDLGWFQIFWWITFRYKSGCVLLLIWNRLRGTIRIPHQHFINQRGHFNSMICLLFVWSYTCWLWLLLSEIRPFFVPIPLAHELSSLSILFSIYTRSIQNNWNYVDSIRFSMPHFSHCEKVRSKLLKLRASKSFKCLPIFDVVSHRMKKKEKEERNGSNFVFDTSTHEIKL